MKTSEATSTSSDGLFPSPETPVRKVLYTDNTGKLYGVLDSDGRFFIHTELYEPEKLSIFKHYKEVLDNLEDALREKGLARYYTMADSPEGYRFNQHMGFESNLEVWDDLYEVMVKEL